MTICGGGGHLIEGRQIWHIRGGGGVGTRDFTVSFGCSIWRST